ncbi:MAG TPA: ABC transporter ATP-binding protein [Gaiellaceae bacterium]|jgi:ATP-binding cassette subfamily B protein|nr:ABC transporter ATP-binding protein [Gaiellaceae bacterium]
MTSARRRGRYRTLLAYAWPYRRGWAAIAVATLLTTAVGLLGPWPMKLLVDNVLGDKPLPAELASLPGVGSPETLLLWVVAGGLAVFAAAAALDVALTYLWIRVGQSLVYDLARDLFARLQRRSLLFHRRTPVGDSLSRVTDDSWCVHTVVDELVFTPGHAIVAGTGVVLVMVHLSPFLTLVAFVVAPLMVLASLALGRPIRRAGKRLRAAEIEIQSHVQQTFAGIPVVQAFGQEQRHHARFQRLAGAAIRAQFRTVLAGGLNGLASGFVTACGTALFLWLAAREVLAGNLTIGGLLVFAAYVAVLHEQFDALTGIYSKLQETRASIDRVADILNAEPEVRDRPGARRLTRVRGHVSIERVTFGYEPTRPVLQDVSLEARPGETVAIVGPTGAGKSTLVSLVPRFFDPQQGRVTLDGDDVRDLQLRSLRDQVALVLQESFLFPVSIAENVAFGSPDATRLQIERAARAAGAHEFVTRLPHGYDTVVGERGTTLSGGERQRIAIARALLKDAPILILDEPTSALDAETEHALLGALERLMEGRTTFVVAHRPSTIRHADRVVALEGGQLAEPDVEAVS